MPTICPGESLAVGTFQSTCEDKTDSQIILAAIWIAITTLLMFMPITYALPQTCTITTLLHVGHVRLRCLFSLVSYISDLFSFLPPPPSRTDRSFHVCPFLISVCYSLSYLPVSSWLDSRVPQGSKMMYVHSWARHHTWSRVKK